MTKIKDLFTLSVAEGPKTDRPREKLIQKGPQNLVDPVRNQVSNGVDKPIFVHYTYRSEQK